MCSVELKVIVSTSVGKGVAIQWIRYLSNATQESELSILIV
jgi:hypothetical protein